MPNRPTSLAAPHNSTLCTLCAISCDVTDSLTSRCIRRNHWISGLPSNVRTTIAPDIEQLANLVLDSHSLIWLDACDVQTTRAAVKLAQRTGATLHVGQSPGAVAVKNVIASSGWFGTTLAEVAPRAEVIVTVGDGSLSESPLLAERFFRAKSQLQSPHWIHISPNACAPHNDLTDALIPNELIHWPRERWFEHFSKLALCLTQNEPIESPDVRHLGDRLRGSSNTVWLWDIDDFHFQTDELTIRRLVSIASALNATSRCTLLPLDMNVGRVTAEETLLWLTGCAGTAVWRGDHWYRSSRYIGYSLEQWSAEFPSIVLISNVASDRALPNLPATLVLQSRTSNASSAVTAPSDARTIQVAAVGLDCSGHLFRGDRGTVHFAKAITPSSLPAAADILSQFTNQLTVHSRSAASEVCDAN